MRIEKHPGLRSTELSMPQSNCQLTNLNFNNRYDNNQGDCVDWTQESVGVGWSGSAINGSRILDIVFSTICFKMFFAANSNKEDEDDRAEVEEKPTRI